MRGEDSEAQKLCKNQASKLSRTSILKLKNIQSKNHPNHLPRSQRSLESSPKASRNLNKPQIGEALRIQAFKAPRNFHYKPSNTKNIRSRIIQTTCLDLKVHWNQAQKPPETSTNHKSVKLNGFKPLKPRRTSTTNLQRRRTHQEHEEYTKNTKNAKNKGFLTSS